MKRRDSFGAAPIAGTLGAFSFTISPDGEWIAFVSTGQLKRLPVVGGAAVTLVDGGVGSSRGIAWLDDGSIVFAQGGGGGLMRVPDAGGIPTPLRTGDFPISPEPVPGSRNFTYAACTGAMECDLWVHDARADSSHLLVPGAVAGKYVRTGHLLYVQANGMMLAVPFDAKRLDVRGTPIPLLDSVSVRSALAPSLSLSRSGTLVMRTGGAISSYDMVWVNRDGRVAPTDPAWRFQLTATASNHGWALSPDGGRLAIGLNTEQGDDIWVKRLPDGPLSRVSYDPATDYRPRWSPDGQYVIYASDRDSAGLYQRRADGTGQDSLLVGGSFQEGTWSPDGTWLLLRGGAGSGAPGGRDITGVRPGIDSVPVPVLATMFDEDAIALSPNGRVLAYQSDETGRTEVFIRPFPNVDAGKRQVSNGGGVAPLWSRDGAELFYLNDEQEMMVASITPGATLTTGEPHGRELLRGSEDEGGTVRW
jgi:hypothetical protein